MIILQVWSLTKMCTIFAVSTKQLFVATTGRRGSCPFRKRSLPFLRHFFLRVFLLKEKEIPTQGSNPDHSHRNLCLSPLHYHTDPPKVKYVHKKTVFLTVTSVTVTLALSIAFNVNSTWDPTSFFLGPFKSVLLPYCNLILGIYYIYRDWRLGYQSWHRPLKMATCCLVCSDLYTVLPWNGFYHCCFCLWQCSSVFLWYIYVIHRLGGPYWEKLCPRSWVPPEAVGRGRYSDRGHSFSQYGPT